MWFLLFHQWSSEDSHVCASICGLLLVLHISLKMVQTISMGPKISRCAEKQQKQHHVAEGLLGIHLDLRNGDAPYPYWSHGEK